MLNRLRSMFRRSVLKVLPERARHALILKGMAGPAPEELGVTVADTAELLEEAAELTFNAYHARHLVEGRGVPLRVTPYLLLPTTVVFVARRRGEVIGTMSLIPDSELGLPMESTFGTEVGALRKSGRRIAEVGALAVKRGERGRGLAMLLYKAMWLTSVKLLDVQELVIAVHPDAEALYRAPFLFERMAGGVRNYGGLRSAALAVGLRRNLETYPTEAQRAFAKDDQTRFNPRRFLLEETHPQIQLPASRAALDSLRAAHTRAALRMASLRPDTLLSLTDSTFESLQRAMASASFHAP